CTRDESVQGRDFFPKPSHPHSYPHRGRLPWRRPSGFEPPDCCPISQSERAKSTSQDTQRIYTVARLFCKPVPSTDARTRLPVSSGGMLRILRALVAVKHPK